MKKITSKEKIVFRVNGAPGAGGTVLHIDENGCIADDRDAAIVAERLGSQVQISDVDAKKAVSEAKKMEPERVARPVLDEIKEADQKQEEVEKKADSDNQENEKVEKNGDGQEESEQKSLADMKRSELDDLATKIGIDPKQYSNADELREAIASKSK